MIKTAAFIHFLLFGSYWQLFCTYSAIIDKHYEHKDEGTKMTSKPQTKAKDFRYTELEVIMLF